MASLLHTQMLHRGEILRDDFYQQQARQERHLALSQQVRKCQLLLLSIVLSQQIFK